MGLQRTPTGVRLVLDVPLPDATAQVDLSQPAIQMLVCHALLHQLQGRRLQDALEYLMVENGLLSPELEMMPPPRLVEKGPIHAHVVGIEVATLPDVIDPTP